MPKDFLDPAQLQRSDQLYFTHKALSNINEAAKEAVKLHDKYMDAIDKLIATVLDNSDCMEETRKLFGPRGETLIAPTFEVTGRLADSVHAWATSPELSQLRADMEALADLSSTAKRSVKLAEKSSSDLEKAAQKAARFSTDKKQRKMGDLKTSRQRRLKAQQDEATAQVQVMDNAVIESMLSLGKWWSSKVVAVSDGLYNSFADAGAAVTRFFPSLPPAMRPAREPLPVHTQPSAESTPTTSRHLRSTAHTDPAVVSSPSAPSSLVSGRQLSSADVGAGHPPARTTPALASTAVPPPPPPPLFAAAAAATPGQQRGGGGNSNGNAAPPPPMAGSPLLFRAGDRPQHQCSAD